MTSISTPRCGRTQQNGSALEPLWGAVGAVGHYDYGGMTMARTVSVDSANQVYLGPTATSATTPRALAGGGQQRQE